MKALTFFSLVVLFSFGQTACNSEEKHDLPEEQKALLENDDEMMMALKDWAQQEQVEVKQEAYSKDIYDKYIDNSLKTGATPYAPCYGTNISCTDKSCSKITVKASNENDLVASIKQDGKFVGHAYVKRGESYSFLVPDGTYQTFIFMGKGWHPERKIMDEVCGTLLGGFLANENYTYDEPVQITNQVIDFDMELFDRLKRGKKIDLPREQEEDDLIKFAKETYAKYINYSLQTGDTPYTPCYGTYLNCSGTGCSKIIVKASKEKDLVASLKQDDKFIGHAYILRGESFTFEVPDGSYQPFFFMGRGWYPERKIKDNECGNLKGGFLSNVNYISDQPVALRNKVVMYDMAFSEEFNKAK